MKCIQLMMEEHEKINAFLRVVRQACIEILEGAVVCEEDFRKFIDFARNYCDKHHHGKEETFLFGEMIAHGGETAANLVEHGMLVEHNLCRGHILDLETALNYYCDLPTPSLKLDIIEAAAGYARLLQLHTEKEDNAVYGFGERMLPEEIKEKVDTGVREFENDPENIARRDYYLGMLKELQEKYHTT